VTTERNGYTINAGGLVPVSNEAQAPVRSRSATAGTRKPLTRD
jgi:hypothetical protein